MLWALGWSKHQLWGLLRAVLGRAANMSERDFRLGWWTDGHRMYPMLSWEHQEGPQVVARCHALKALPWMRCKGGCTSSCAWTDEMIHGLRNGTDSAHPPPPLKPSGAPQVADRVQTVQWPISMGGENMIPLALVGRAGTLTCERNG